MTPTEQLKSILTKQYVSEDGYEYKVELKQGLTDQQINELAEKLSTEQSIRPMNYMFALCIISL